MRSTHRIIKFFGMALAIVLTIAIIGGVSYFLIGVSKGFHWSSKNGKEEVINSTEYPEQEFDSIDVESGIVSIDIKKGDKYQIEKVNVPEDMKIDIEVNDHTLEIHTEDYSVKKMKPWFFGKLKNQEAKLIITVPKNFEGKDITITCGTGNIKMKDITIEHLDIEGGVGNIEAKDLTANEVDIQSGVGNIEFEDVDLTDCEIECGTGNISIDGKMYGKNSISGGVGNTELKLDGSRKDYSFDVSASGLGSIRINGEKVKDLDDNSEAKNSFEISGGVGSISIDFSEK